MKRVKPFVCLAACVFLAACGSKQDANEKNFGAALSDLLAKRGELCVSLGFRWPVEIPVSNRQPPPTSQEAQLAALEGLGLLKSEIVETDGGFLGGSGGRARIQAKRYAVADAGKPYFHESYAGLAGPAFCYAKTTLDRVEKWDQPVSLGDYKEVSVTYTVKTVDIAPWVQTPSIKASFPMIETTLSRQQQPKHHALKLTNQGWEAKGL